MRASHQAPQGRNSIRSASIRSAISRARWGQFVRLRDDVVASRTTRVDVLFEFSIQSTMRSRDATAARLHDSMLRGPRTLVALAAARNGYVRATHATTRAPRRLAWSLAVRESSSKEALIKLRNAGAAY
ncbi:hypothetical protein AKJ09_02156 [Labilithrix luteola]|uniref:Uncharacterized protein n=1 Tax=Labilithrix luteola TaxID=1391654 RepID=A0A0K1PPP7_9BACT|nr:hypothetical protein AKJ09_02156 [Labilithrix luteola]